MKDVQNRERLAPAKPLVAIGELQFEPVKQKKLILTPACPSVSLLTLNR